MTTEAERLHRVRGVTVWMTPPDVIAFWCEYRLQPTEEV
jgi:hypothetical protein